MVDKRNSENQSLHKRSVNLTLEDVKRFFYKDKSLIQYSSNFASPSLPRIIKIIFHSEELILFNVVVSCVI